MYEFGLLLAWSTTININPVTPQLIYVINPTMLGLKPTENITRTLRWGLKPKLYNSEPTVLGTQTNNKYYQNATMGIQTKTILYRSLSWGFKPKLWLLQPNKVRDSNKTVKYQSHKILWYCPYTVWDSIQNYVVLRTLNKTKYYQQYWGVQLWKLGSKNPTVLGTQTKINITKPTALGTLTKSIFY